MPTQKQVGKAPNQVLRCTKHHQDTHPSPRAGNVRIPLSHCFLSAPKSPLSPLNYGSNSKVLQEQGRIPQGKMLLEPVPAAPSARAAPVVWWDPEHPGTPQALVAVPCPPHCQKHPENNPGCKPRYLMGRPPALLTQFLPGPCRCLFYQRPRLLPGWFPADRECRAGTKELVLNHREISPQ